MLKIAYSPIYKYSLPEGHRFPMVKYELIPEQLLYEGTIDESAFFHPKPLIHNQLILTHSPEYLHKLDHQLLDRNEIRKIGFPMTNQLVTRGKHISSGTYMCAKYALEYGVSMNIAGGTHHSFADHGEGFCVYNDIAIASRLILEEKLVKQILVVDLDVHQGNGTASIFKEDSKVFTFSMHGEKNYPIRKEKSDLDIDLPDGTEDALYLSILDYQLKQVIDKVEPDFIFYLSGVDILASDKLGRLSVSMKACKKRDQLVLEKCYNCNIPIAISMGGGYSESIVAIVEAHANTFRSAQYIYF